MAEHIISKSTGGFYHTDGSPCISRAKRIFARGVMRRPNAVVRSSHNRRVGQLDDVPELVDALAQTPDGTVQVPQNVVHL